MLLQRTQTERFLIDSLALVRKEIAAESRARLPAVTLGGVRPGGQPLLQGGGSTGPGSTGARRAGWAGSGKDAAASQGILRLGAPGSAGARSQASQHGGGGGGGGGLDLADLSWEDRERVLRLVFSKINENRPELQQQQQY